MVLRMHGHRLNNQKDPNYKHKNAPREGRSEAHLECIRNLSCSVCPAPARSDPHHLMSMGGRGMAKREADRHTVPLCRVHHDEVERVRGGGERAWFMQFGIDCARLAEALWKATGNAAQMEAIVQAHRAGRPDEGDLPW